MGYSITSANPVVVLSVVNLLPPTQIQGFSTDSMFSNDAIDNAELMMGVDSKLAGGWIPVPVVIGFDLMANSGSLSFFEAWYSAEQQIKDKYQCAGSITIPATGRTYVAQNGFLTSFQVLPNAAKVLQPRTSRVTFETVVVGGI